MEGVAIIVKSHKEALHQIDILGRDDHAEGIGAEYEDKHCHERASKHCLGIIDRRVAYVAHMHARHLHAGIKQKYRGRQHYIVKVGEVGKKVAVEVHFRVASDGEVDHTKHHQQDHRNDGTNDASHFRHLAYPAESLHRDQGGEPR